MFYVYILESEEGELYFGSTTDLKRRLREHNTNKSHSTKDHKWILIFYEAYRSKDDAVDRERRIKQHGQAKAQLKRRIKRSRLHQS